MKRHTDSIQTNSVTGCLKKKKTNKQKANRKKGKERMEMKGEAKIYQKNINKQKSCKKGNITIKKD